MTNVTVSTQDGPGPDMELYWQRVDRVLVGVGVVLALAVAWAHRETPLLAGGLLGVVLVSARLSSIDFRVHRLPNRIVGRLALCVTFGIVVAGGLEGDVGRAAIALLAGCGCCIGLFLIAITGSLGVGDAKYGYCVAAVLGWFGWPAAQVALVVTSLASGLVAATLLAIGTGHRRMAYGPYMALGLVAGLVHAGSL